MYFVRLKDLEKAIAAFHKKCPQIHMFTSIEGNAYGDFIIRSAVGSTYIVKHSDFSVWRYDDNWKNKWVEII